MTTGNGNIINNVLTDTKDGIVTSTYEKDYAYQGKAFQIQRRFAIASSATSYFVLDTTPLVIAEKRVSILPLIMSTGEGLAYVDTYAITSYTGGTPVPFARVNSDIANYAESIFKTGVTPTGSPGDDLRQYIVGSKSTNQNAGGGVSSQDIAKQFPAGVKIVGKVENKETSETVLELGLIIYEF